MGLSVSLSNALSGMNATQRGLEVLSRNVSSAGVSGYHKQTISSLDQNSNNSSSVGNTEVTRAFNEAVQRYYNQNVSNAGYSDVRAEFLSRLEVFIGKPGSETSLDTLYQDFELSMQGLAVSPDDFATRAQVVSTASSLASGLNRLSTTVQDLRQETELQLSSHVNDLNRMLQSLESVNNSLKDNSGATAPRLNLLDERDRLVAGISELMDVSVSYRDNDSVALMTSTGLGLIDEVATQFEFRPAGEMQADSLFSPVDSENGVGSLIARTPSGYEVDLVEQNVLRGGRLGALVELRDITLVGAQNQIDEIASSLAQSFSSVTTDGTAVVGPPDGFSLDVGNVLPGDDFTVSYTEGAVTKTVKVVRVDDATKLPMDVTGTNGVRTIGLDFSGGIGAVAAALDTALGASITVSNPSGDVIQIVDDGLAATSDIGSLTSHATASASQTGDLAFSLFTDGSKTYSNSLDGYGQKVGFSGRITVNSEVMMNNELLVKFSSSTSLGNADRAEYLLDSLQNSSFAGTTTSTVETGTFRLTGNAQNMIIQMMNFQGNSITAANSQLSSDELSLEAVSARLGAEYDVNVDEEMARLIELQNAYSASARIVSVVQELIDMLISI